MNKVLTMGFASLVDFALRDVPLSAVLVDQSGNDGCVSLGLRGHGLNDEKRSLEAVYLVLGEVTLEAGDIGRELCLFDGLLFALNIE